MTKHNQTGNHLRWSMGGEAFECEPWGRVDIPERFGWVPASMGLPLGNAPVDPETRASVRAKAARVDARADELRVLKATSAAAQAQTKAADAELELVRGELANEIKLRFDAEASCERLDAALTEAKADVAAMGVKLKESAERIADLEQAQKLKPLQPHVSQKHGKQRR